MPYKIYLRLSGRNSAVECQLPKLDVVGSIPIARSTFFLTIGISDQRRDLFCSLEIPSIPGQSQIALYESLGPESHYK
jgi:hypothetical protein